VKFVSMTEHEHKEAHAKSASKSSESSGITGYVHGFLQSVLDSLSKTLRSFVAFAMAIFFLGTVFGFLIPHITSRVAIEPGLLIGAPLVLAVLAYYFTEIAALIFILLLGVFLLFFL